MKKIIALLACIVLAVSLCPVAFAAVPPKIVDQADILTDGEEELLEQKAQDLADTYDMDVVILTVESLGGTYVESYADDYYDYNGYGIGEDYSGVLLLLSMSEREWAISTCGETIYALTDYGIQSVFEEISWYLSVDSYYLAFDAYLDELNTYFTAYSNGNPIDGYADSYDGPGSYEPGTKEDVVYYPDEEMGLKHVVTMFFTSLIIGVIVAGIALLIMRSGMNTAKQQSGASSYIKQGTYSLTRQQDFFLYSRVSKTRRAESNNHGGGGSSIHRSSSGRSHGGGHGRF